MTLKATVSFGLTAVKTLTISCPIDGTPCKQAASAAGVTLQPGTYGLATESYYCDGTGGTLHAALASVATLTNKP